MSERCLVMLRGPELGRRIPIDRPELVIGRGSDCDAPVHERDVSRRHCRLEIRDGVAFVRDLGSTNGTLLGGRPLPPGEDFPLRGGDLLQIGDCVLKYLEEGDLETRYHEEVYRSMVVDGLTQVYNRRFLVELLEREISRCRRHERHLSLILVDIDHFKRVNDEAGHTAGDQVLRCVAACLAGQVRRESCVARYGGEEFAVVLPETGPEGALVLGERMRGAVEMLEPEVEGQTFEITISAGVAEWQIGYRNVEDLIRAADTNLYAAKKAGRNRVVG